MKVYFYAPESSSPALVENSRTIADILRRAGVDVITKNMDAAEAFPDSYKQLEQRGQSLLDHVAAIVIEGTEPDPEVGYLLAYAIAQKRPALLLTAKGNVDRNPLQTFGAQQVPKTLSIARYLPAQLEQIVVGFLQELGEIEYLEIPSIKFTLRITPQIERYLHWKTHNTPLSKADFLRKILLEDIIARDESYQRYRRKRKSSDQRK